jgi:hypothetical protein
MTADYSCFHITRRGKQDCVTFDIDFTTMRDLLKLPFSSTSGWRPLIRIRPSPSRVVVAILGVVVSLRKRGPFAEPGTDDMVLKNIFLPKNLAKKIGIFYSKQDYIMQKFDHNIGVLRKTPFVFAENYQKIAEKWDHNIDPRSLYFTVLLTKLNMHCHCV